MTGLPSAPDSVGFGGLPVVAYYVDDALQFFGIVRLAQIVGELERRRGDAADLAVAAERLQATRELQPAIGERLAEIRAKAMVARRLLSGDTAEACAHIAAAGITAREAVAQARLLAAVIVSFTAGSRPACLRARSSVPGWPGRFWPGCWRDSRWQTSPL